MTRCNRRQAVVLAVGASLLVGSSGVWADDEKELDRTPQQCVTSKEIARNEAVSDRSIVFIMRGNQKMYRNDLRAVCSTLQKGASQLDFVKGNHPASQLCGNSDGFTVRGKQSLPCALGTFQPITQAEAEKLLGRPLADDTSKKSGNKAK